MSAPDLRLLVVGDADPVTLGVFGLLASLGHTLRLQPGTAADGHPGDARDAVLLLPGRDLEGSCARAREVAAWSGAAPIVLVAEDPGGPALRALIRAGATDLVRPEEIDASLTEVVRAAAARVPGGRVPPAAAMRAEVDREGPEVFDEEPTVRLSGTARAAIAALTRMRGDGSASPPPLEAPRPVPLRSATSVSHGYSGGSAAAHAVQPRSTTAPVSTPVVSVTARDLPLLDPRIAELQALMERPDVELRHVEAFATTDPALVATVIRASNAAYYRSTKVVTNLRDACVRIGSRQVFALLLQTLVERSFEVASMDGRRVLSAGWRNATVTARLSRKLAEWLGFGRPEDVYVAGMLHNLGELVLVWRLVEAAPTQLAGRLVDEAPRIVNSHESIGRQVAERWGMPPLVQMLAGCHHKPRPGARIEDERLRQVVLGCWALSRQLLGDYLPNQAPADPELSFAALGLGDPVRAKLAEESASAVTGL